MITRSDHAMDVQAAELSHREDPREGLSTPSSLRAVSPSWLASYWGVHVRTVYRDIGKGALKAFRLPSGQFRIRLTDARRYGRPVD